MSKRIQINGSSLRRNPKGTGTSVVKSAPRFCFMFRYVETSARYIGFKPLKFLQWYQTFPKL